ncbi:methyl-accepting chemotaxis protein [Sphingobium sp. AP49]|uniref:methyl-accepting chemotaxis protein n=1 Tax=Sphingobium sp. AP49 TaxID=1144307 RepID=UPI00026EE7C0|nr:methyl-accepting chemotaxis protein [Sphingobium sp. AP49]WHO40695.1 methyl-accepting chemotaxis protein [Sphingobium sp. AP49]
MSTEKPMESIRLAGARMLMCVFWLNVPGLCVAGFLVGSADTPLVTFAAILLALLPTWMVIRRDVAAPARLSLAMTTMAFPALYLFLLRNHAWQMDMHMTFFAALAALTALLDRRALLAGAAVTAVHHLALNFTQPDWVFASGGDLPRVLFHALIVILQTAMLLWIVARLTQMILLQADEKQRSDALRIEADDAKLRAEHALDALERAQMAATRQRAIEEAARRAEESAERRRLVADALEARLGAVVTDLGQLSRQLSISKQWLFDLLQLTTLRSAELQAAHMKADGDVRAVAKDTEKLANSINEVGSSACHSRDNALRGAMATQALTPEVEILSATVDSASSIVALISQIASQSRTLSLNAGIEAARSGTEVRGFAVVASEMKSLAAQTADATRQIDSYLHDIRRAAQSVSGAIEVASKSAEMIDSSTAEIVEEVAAQIRATSEIAAATDEMARHIAEAAAQAEALSGALKEAQGAMGETDAAASALSSRSEELQETVRNVLEELRAA